LSCQVTAGELAKINRTPYSKIKRTTAEPE
jgi:hypothetical protein